MVCLSSIYTRQRNVAGECINGDSLNAAFLFQCVFRSLRASVVYITGLICILLCLGGCSPSKKSGQTGQGSLDDVFAYEKRVLLDMIDLLERFKARITNAETAEEMTAANWELVEKLERLKPEITELTVKHPEWGKNPPPELSLLIQKYLNANRDFTTMSMQIIFGFLKDHPDDKELAESYEAVKALTKSNKDEKAE
jgi:hypothetical protein